MKFAVFAVLAASANAFAPAAFVARPSTGLNANLAETLKTMQGPHICYGSDGPTMDPPHDENEIKGYDNCDKFLAEVEKAGIDLSSGEYTVFAPVNSAMEKFASGGMSAEEVKYHIAEGKHTSGSISGDITTLTGKALIYERKFRKTFMDEAIIGQVDNFGGGSAYPVDVAADNGVIHTISVTLDPAYTKQNAEAGLGGVA
eukprot:CAMPEP_0182452754 /NCGR_PEP_ID=MMETSP1319-20130603/100_1 /TAXON_ID=172717 /ORGANISM="Bolidomonas pacifica, Strain RCC208" /LENGTH=200 /DNA_ID=CAMNT_0024650617 /DNA_START=30 /DNA_END=632 /DNA_ORIENTATION=+